MLHYCFTHSVCVACIPSISILRPMFVEYNPCDPPATLRHVRPTQSSPEGDRDSLLTPLPWNHHNGYDLHRERQRNLDDCVIQAISTQSSLNIGRFKDFWNVRSVFFTHRIMSAAMASPMIVLVFHSFKRIRNLLRASLMFVASRYIFCMCGGVFVLADHLYCICGRHPLHRV